MTEALDTRTARHVPILDPTPARRKRIIELFNKFLENKASLAELKGVSRERLFQLSEAGWIKLKHGRIDEAEQIFRSLIILDYRYAYFHAVMGAIY